ncbi:MAG: hypothetical protein Q8M53_00375 [Burkholderiales bacterium]|nr:hypothetical protein [Burkholderiales bacterium]
MTDLLIHATLTVSGERAQLPAVEARIATLLAAEANAGEFEAHHGEDALAYDFMVRGGIPFPAFAAASQEFPGITITAEWVNVGAGRRGRARLSNGGITEHVEEALDTAAGEANRYLEAAADATISLAFALQRRAAGEWVGYVLNHERDALFRITRDGDAVELLATEGAAEWAWRWQGGPDIEASAVQAVVPPQPLDRELYAELESLAEGFVGDGFWLRDAAEADNAIELDRFVRYGYTVRDANVRAARLHRLRADLGADAALEHSTLDADNIWIRDLLLRCWQSGA